MCKKSEVEYVYSEYLEAKTMIIHKFKQSAWEKIPLSWESEVEVKKKPFEFWQTYKIRSNSYCGSPSTVTPIDS
jgi:hypothetical protein